MTGDSTTPKPVEIKIDFKKIGAHFAEAMKEKMAHTDIDKAIGYKAVEAFMEKVADDVATGVHAQLTSKQLAVPLQGMQGLVKP